MADLPPKKLTLTQHLHRLKGKCIQSGASAGARAKDFRKMVEDDQLANPDYYAKAIAEMLAAKITSVWDSDGRVSDDDQLELWFEVELDRRILTVDDQERPGKYRKVAAAEYGVVRHVREQATIILTTAAAAGTKGNKTMEFYFDLRRKGHSDETKLKDIKPPA